MSTIGSLNNYYQLSSVLSGGAGGGASTAGSAATPSLAAALDAISQSTSQSDANAYQLNLSPQAQKLLGTASSNSTSSGSSGDNFLLTQAQQTTIRTILSKYASAPFDQATFSAIQNDLSAAGLSPQTLGAKDQVTSFNATATLLQALNGDYGTLQDSAASASGEQTKQSRYMQQIVSLWKSSSTVATSA